MKYVTTRPAYWHIMSFAYLQENRKKNSHLRRTRSIKNRGEVPAQRGEKILPDFVEKALKPIPQTILKC